MTKNTATTTLVLMIAVHQSSMVQSWAPVQVSPTTLPKVLEFAERAWSFPKAEDLPSSATMGPRSLPEKIQQRMLPWTHRQEHATDTTNSLHKISNAKQAPDRYYFDGYSGAFTEWPTREAFLVSISKPATSDVKMVPRATADFEEVSSAEYYYDDMGALVTWASSPAKKHQVQQEEGCQHYFFDGITGKSICWTSAVSAAENLASSVKIPPKPMLNDILQECSYFDDSTGEVLCWA